jgi:hypothetical protein
MQEPLEAIPYVVKQGVELEDAILHTKRNECIVAEVRAGRYARYVLELHGEFQLGDSGGIITDCEGRISGILSAVAESKKKAIAQNTASIIDTLQRYSE